MWNFNSSCISLTPQLIPVAKFPTHQARLQCLINNDEIVWHADNLIDCIRVLFGFDASAKKLNIFAEEQEELVTALQKVSPNGDIPQFAIAAVPLIFVPTVLHWLQRSGLDNIKQAHIYGIFVLDKGVNLACWKRNDETITPLTIDDIATVVHNWEIRKNEPEEETKRYVRKAIQTRPSACIRDGEGQPIAWALCHTDWSIGALTTLEKYRKQGYGRRVVVHLVEAIHNTGRPACAQISPDNDISIACFQSIGFKQVGLIQRIYRNAC